MNTTDISTSMLTCNNSWSSYLTLGMNFIIIVLSLGKQFLNSKNFTALTSTLKPNATPNVNISTEQIELVQSNIPENLKTSVKQE